MSDSRLSLVRDTLNIKRVRQLFAAHGINARVERHGNTYAVYDHGKVQLFDRWKTEADVIADMKIISQDGEKGGA